MRACPSAVVGHVSAEQDQHVSPHRQPHHSSRTGTTSPTSVKSHWSCPLLVPGTEDSIHAGSASKSASVDERVARDACLSNTVVRWVQTSVTPVLDAKEVRMMLSPGRRLRGRESGA